MKDTPHNLNRKARFYDPSFISKSIANGHAKKHFNGDKPSEMELWKSLGVTSKDEYQRKIYETLLDKNTKVFQGIEIEKNEKTKEIQLKDKRDIYYNKKNNIIIIVNHRKNDFGTAFIAKEKSKSFNDLYQTDLNDRKKFNLKKSYVMKGGYNKLYNSKNITNKRQEFKANFTSNKPNPRGFKAYVDKEKALILKLEKKKVIQKELTKNEKLIQRKVELELIRRKKKESVEKNKTLDEKQKLEKTAQIQKLKEKVKTSEALNKDKTEVEKKRTEEEKRKKLEELQRRLEEIRRIKEAERKEKEKQKEIQFYKKN